MQGSIAIASILKREGVEQLFCLPINPLIEACAELRIRPYIARTERHAIGMADGFSRVTNGRRIGVCASQFGPGAENSFGGIAQVYSDSTPVLYLAAGPNQSRLGVLPTFDIMRNYEKVTKYVARVNSVGRIPEFMRRVFTYVRAGRPGAVALEVPMGVMSAEFYGTRYITGDYSKIGEGLGAYTERVEKPEEIAGAIKRAQKYMSEGRPALLETMTREETKLSKYW